MNKNSNGSKTSLADVLIIIKKTKRGKIGAAIIVCGIILFVLKSINFLTLLVFGVVGDVFIASVGAGSNAREKFAMEAKHEAIKASATKCVGDYLYVNENAQTWCVPSAGLVEYKFSDLLDFSVVQDGETISSGNVLNAIAGGVVFGWAGLLVGANKTKTAQTCSKLQVQLNVNSISNPIIRIDLISYEVKRSSDDYKKAVSIMEEITGILRVIKSRNQS